MCQIIGISNITGLDKKDINKLAIAAKNLTKSQGDGYGFAYSTLNRQTKEHTYYCEKYVNPNHFNGIGSVGGSKGLMKAFQDAIEMPMLSSGHPDKPTGPIIFHGRISTNDRSLKNTHPFRKQGWAMVHNGVVDLDNIHATPWRKRSSHQSKLHDQINDRYSSCDSEWLLNTYIHAKGHSDWAEHLSGYAATMTIDPKNNFIIAKDSRARLYMAGIPALNKAVIFATCPTHCAEMAKTLGLASTPAYKIIGGRAITITPSNKITIEKFEEMTTSPYISQSAINKSIGYNPTGYNPPKTEQTTDHSTYTQHPALGKKQRKAERKARIQTLKSNYSKQEETDFPNLTNKEEQYIEDFFGKNQ